MKVTITSIVLKSPFKFFPFSWMAMSVFNQLKSAKYVKFKKQGFLSMHYTMTLWENEKDLKSFAMDGAHREAMKKTAKIAREIRIYTYDADSLPDWKSAKNMLLEHGRVTRYK